MMKLTYLAGLIAISLIAVSVFGKPTAIKNKKQSEQELLDSIGNKKWACLYGKPGQDASKNMKLADPHAFVEIYEADAGMLKIDITTGDGQLTSSFYGSISETESLVKFEVKKQVVFENNVQVAESSSAPRNSLYRVAPPAHQWFIQAESNQLFKITINKAFTPSGTLTCQDT